MISLTSTVSQNNGSNCTISSNKKMAGNPKQNTNWESITKCNQQRKYFTLIFVDKTVKRNFISHFTRTSERIRSKQQYQPKVMNYCNFYFVQQKMRPKTKKNNAIITFYVSSSFLVCHIDENCIIFQLANEMNVLATVCVVRCALAFANSMMVLLARKWAKCHNFTSKKWLNHFHFAVALLRYCKFYCSIICP